MRFDSHNVRSNNVVLPTALRHTDNSLRQCYYTLRQSAPTMKSLEPQLFGNGGLHSGSSNECSGSHNVHDGSALFDPQHSGTLRTALRQCYYMLQQSPAMKPLEPQHSGNGGLRSDILNGRSSSPSVHFGSSLSDPQHSGNLRTRSGT
ncbi:hypothetical protein AMTR_s00099p00126530 [Amborella trichopoda]|uniref:Uncharacterized protein n=1 Tax=Amborella trichopoda TaxID=13333 RepID=W1NRZ2_AMBTC|nr:hypothetical protein AMTR_s00099p00126530 [Amborella trichopoda]